MKSCDLNHSLFTDSGSVEMKISVDGPRSHHRAFIKLPTLLRNTLVAMGLVRIATNANTLVPMEVLTFSTDDGTWPMPRNGPTWPMPKTNYPDDDTAAILSQLLLIKVSHFYAKTAGTCEIFIRFFNNKILNPFLSFPICSKFLRNSANGKYHVSLYPLKELRNVFVTTEMSAEIPRSSF